MKKYLFSSFLIALFAISAIATEPCKLPAIFIDTLYVSTGALQIEYEVIRPFDHVRVYVHSSWDLTSNEPKTVLLNGNTGKGKVSVPVNLITDQATFFNVFITGEGFINKDDSTNYESIRSKSAIFKKSKNNSIYQHRTQYNDKEQSLMAIEKRDHLVFVNSEGYFVGYDGKNIDMEQLKQTRKSAEERYEDPLTVNFHEIKEISEQKSDYNDDPSRAVQNYDFSISGNIRTSLTNGSSGFGTYMPETMVFLLFRHSSSPQNAYWVLTSSSLAFGTNVAITDAAGNFNFKFSINADLSSFNQVIFFVARYNDYVYLDIAGDVLYFSNLMMPIFAENATSTITFNPASSGINRSDIILIEPEILMGGSLGMFGYTGKMTNLLGYNISRIDVRKTNSSSYLGGAALM